LINKLFEPRRIPASLHTRDSFRILPYRNFAHKLNLLSNVPLLQVVDYSYFHDVPVTFNQMRIVTQLVKYGLIIRCVKHLCGVEAEVVTFLDAK
jgi:hypothetical protein